MDDPQAFVAKLLTAIECLANGLSNVAAAAPSGVPGAMHMANQARAIVASLRAENEPAPEPLPEPAPLPDASPPPPEPAPEPVTDNGGKAK